MRPHRDPPLTYQQRLLTAFVLCLCLLAMCALVCQASCCMPAPKAPLVDPVIPVEYAHTVGVAALCPDGIQGGTGVRIDGTRILTARHVLECGKTKMPSFLVAVRDAAGKMHVAIVKRETSRDLAVLEVADLPPIDPVAFGVPQVGEQACATFELPEMGRRCGEVWPHNPTAMDDLVISYVAEMGNSGGPLWDADGRLIGIVTDLRSCMGTGTSQVCTAGAMTLASLGPLGPKFAAQ